MNSFTRIVESPEGTDLLGRQLGGLLFPGSIVALVGPLGAGKTTLTRAIVAGLGAPLATVSSPTFALVHEYAGRLLIYHFDTYRLPDLTAFLNLGVAEYFQGDGVCIIEWADRVEAALPEEYLRIKIEPIDDNRRRFTFASTGAGYEEIVRRLNSDNH